MASNACDPRVWSLAVLFLVACASSPPAAAPMVAVESRKEHDAGPTEVMSGPDGLDEPMSIDRLVESMSTAWTLLADVVALHDRCPGALDERNEARFRDAMSTQAALFADRDEATMRLQRLARLDADGDHEGFAKATQETETFVENARERLRKKITLLEQVKAAFPQRCKR
jgi:hypothetical protein